MAALSVCLITVATLVALVLAAARLGRIAAIGAAYKAKVLCTAVFVSRLDLDPQKAPEVSADAYRILRPLRARIDRSRGTVTAGLFGLKARTAVYRQGLGATLALGEPRPPSGTAAAPRAADAFRSDAPGLTELSGRDSLPRVATGPKDRGARDAVDAAFLEPDPRRPRRTRAVLVLQDGEIVAERYAAGITDTTPLPGWSMAKSAFSALLGIAIGEGRLSLERQALLALWRGPGDARAAICLEDLLRMRSGLRWTEVYSDPLSDVVQMLFAQPDAAAFAADKPLAAAPGTVWQYSSGTTNILSRILRDAVGDEEYPVYPRRILFDPLGMRSAVLEPDASGTFVASSFLLATARDWARLGQLFLQDGVWDGNRLLPEGWVSFVTRPTPQAPGGRFGAHWWLRCPDELGGATAEGARLPRDTYYAFGHEGQTLSVIPSRRLVVVRLGLSIFIDAWNHAAFLDKLLQHLP